MTPFIVILVAAPAVLWLFRRRQGYLVTKTQKDGVLEATTSSKDGAPVQVERAAVTEARLSLDGVLSDAAPEEVLQPESLPPCIPASGSVEDDLVAEPAHEAAALSTSKDDIGTVGYSAAEFISGQLPASPANSESKELVISDIDSSTFLFEAGSTEPAVLQVIAPPAVYNVESVLAQNDENDEISVDPEQEIVRAVTEMSSSASEALQVPELIAANSCGRHEPLAEEMDGPRAEQGDLINSTASNDASSLVRPGTAGGSLFSRELVASEVRPVALENVEVLEPSRYRPPQQRPTRRTPSNAGSGTSRPRSNSALEIRVRLTLDRFGFCQISLLPNRKPDMDDEITVKAGAMRLMLVAQEDWYGDLYFDDIGERLRQGIRLGGLLSDGRRVQWQLGGGRDIYVLAGHPSASGFISVPRLALGRTHIVLCANDVLEQAEAILIQAGCDGYTKLDPSHGIPNGWTGLRGVLPKTALKLNPGIDPFYALKPAPDIDISLEGGLLLHDTAWLSGYPPQIMVTGQTTGALKVLIDGKEAHAADGCYTVVGFDALGQHFVECEGLSCSRSYSIEEPTQVWEAWATYAFFGADVCGPLVSLRPETRRYRLFTVSMSNRLLLGAEPGQVFCCSQRDVPNWHGFVPFEVVWALPAQPLVCDKKSSRILCFSSAPIAPAGQKARTQLLWCNAILDASRKGLRIENGSPELTAQWNEYKKAARSIWRRGR